VKLGINGRFLCAPVTGVQRFAREVAARLFGAADTVLFVPRGAPVPEAWRDAVAIVEGRLTGHVWEQLELPGRAAACDVTLHLAGTAPLRGGRDVLVVHDLLPLVEPAWFAPRYAAWHRFLVPRVVRRSTRLVTTTDAVRNDLVDRLGVQRARVDVAPQGVAPFDRPAGDDDMRRARAIFDLPDRFILALGAGDARKNVPFLTDVVKRWRARDPDAPALVIAGEAERRVHGSARTQGSGAPEVRWLGRVSDAELRALYTLASAFAFPSSAEGFGRPPLEAMACGTPAVVADYPAAAEVVAGEAQIVALAVDAWIHALDAAVRDRDPGRDRARAGRIVARWRWEDAVAVVLAACHAAHESKRGSVAA
jgi:glycosyltransferase involved in cell wall biosynthesis